MRVWNPSRLWQIDLRTLGVFRIYLGLLLVGQWLTVWLGAEEFYSGVGVLPSHYALFAPVARSVSLLTPFSTLAEVRLALLVILAVYVAFLLGVGGLRIRLLTLAAAVSILARNIWVENGGHVVIDLLLVWSLFFPLERRFAWSRRGAVHTDLGAEGCVRGLAPLGMRVSIALIYLFNFLTKTGETWQEGTAVYYTLWLADRVWPLALVVRESFPLPLLRAGSYGALLIEAALPLLVLSPLLPLVCQRLAATMILLLHAGIALAINLGPFSFAMFGWALLLIQPEDWRWLARRWAAPVAAPAPIRRAWPFAALREVLAALLIYTCVAQSIHMYRVWTSTLTEWRPPAWTGVVVDYLRIPQNWRMFAADAPVESRLMRYVGVRGQELVDLESGEPFLPDDPEALDPYFERSHGQTILRIEYDTRVFLMPGGSQQFLLAWLQRRHPGYEGYQAYMLRRRSPEPSTGERSPASAVLIAEQR